MLSINDLKSGVIFLYQNQPFEVLETKHLHLGRGGAVCQTKIKNLKTGAVLSQNFKPSDSFEQADVSRETVKFIYSHRGNYCFTKLDNSSQRFNLTENQIGDTRLFLKPNTILDAFFFRGELLNISLPIKLDLKVVEAPPGVKGDRSEAGTKEVALETGAKIKAPLFIEVGDIVRVNTQTGEYAERVKIKNER